MKDQSTNLPFSGLELSERDKRALRRRLRYARLSAILACFLLVLGGATVFLTWNSMASYARWFDEPNIDYSVFPYNDAKYVLEFFVGVFWLIVGLLQWREASSASLLRRLADEIDKLAAPFGMVGPEGEESSPDAATP